MKKWAQIIGLMVVVLCSAGVAQNCSRLTLKSRGNTVRWSLTVPLRDGEEVPEWTPLIYGYDQEQRTSEYVEQTEDGCRVQVCHDLGTIVAEEYRFACTGFKQKYVDYMSTSKYPLKALRCTCQGNSSFECWRETESCAVATRESNVTGCHLYPGYNCDTCQHGYVCLQNRSTFTPTLQYRSAVLGPRCVLTYEQIGSDTQSTQTFVYDKTTTFIKEDWKVNEGTVTCDCTSAEVITSTARALTSTPALVSSTTPESVTKGPKVDPEYEETTTNLVQPILITVGSLVAALLLVALLLIKVKWRSKGKGRVPKPRISSTVIGANHEISKTDFPNTEISAAHDLNTEISETHDSNTEISETHDSNTEISEIRDPNGDLSLIRDRDFPSNEASGSDLTTLDAPEVTVTQKVLEPETTHKAKSFLPLKIWAQVVEELRSFPPVTEISEDLLQIYDESVEGNILGSGEFGVVVRGNVAPAQEAGVCLPVAIKKVKPNQESYFGAIAEELKMLAYIGTHPNIVTLLGYYKGNLEICELFLIYELLENGSLRKYIQLKVNPAMTVENSEIHEVQNSYCKLDIVSTFSKTPIPIAQLIKWSLEIATGLEFLHSKRVIHRDLATRNILLTRDLVAKIGDFGLARHLSRPSPLYIMRSDNPVSWKWTALESLFSHYFTIESDIWSFGVTLWEIFAMTGIREPYEGIAVNELQLGDRLIHGYRLPAPLYASEQIYSKIKDCWLQDPSLRPTARDLKEFLENQTTT